MNATLVVVEMIVGTAALFFSVMGIITLFSEQPERRLQVLLVIGIHLIAVAIAFK